LSASTPSASHATTPSLHSPTIEDVEDEDGPTPAPGTRDWNCHKRLDSNRLPARCPKKQQIIIASDEENEEAGSTGTDNAVSHVRRGFPSGVCLSVSSKSKLNTIATVGSRKKAARSPSPDVEVQVLDAIKTTNNRKQSTQDVDHFFSEVITNNGKDFRKC